MMQRVSRNLFEELNQVGWFDNLPPSLREEAVMSAQKAAARGENTWTPPVAVALDQESLEYYQHPYLDLLKKFANASYSILNPQNVIEDYRWENDGTGRFHLNFDHQDKAYSISLEHTGSWINPQFFTLLDEVMKDTKSGLCFVDLANVDPFRDQVSFYVLCDPLAFEKANKANLLSSYQFDVDSRTWRPTNPWESIRE